MPTQFGAFNIPMHASDAWARELVANESGLFGADLLRFPPGGRVPMHTHAGDHILLVLAGEGLLLYGIEESLRLRAGVIYFVDQFKPHEIQAKTELVLVSVGNQRRLPGDVDRLALCEAPHTD